jgi:hypothetical protein
VFTDVLLHILKYFSATLITARQHVETLFAKSRRHCWQFLPAIVQSLSKKLIQFKATFPCALSLTGSKYKSENDAVAVSLTAQTDTQMCWIIIDISIQWWRLQPIVVRRPVNRQRRRNKQLFNNCFKAEALSTYKTERIQQQELDTIIIYNPI